MPEQDPSAPEPADLDALFKKEVEALKLRLEALKLPPLDDVENELRRTVQRALIARVVKRIILKKIDSGFDEEFVSW